MSKLQPKPGKTLVAALEEAKEIVAVLSDIATHEIPPDQPLAHPRLMEFLASVPAKLVNDLDGLKLMMNKLEEAEITFQRGAEVLIRQSSIAKFFADTVVANIEATMRSTKQTRFEGKTWVFDLEELPPAIALDEKDSVASIRGYVIKRERSEVDSAQIYADLKAGKQIPGITLTPQFRINSSIKKVKP